MVSMLCNLECYVNLVICILYPFFIWPYSSHRITMQCFTCIYIDINIKYVSIGHIIHFLRSKYGPKTMKILVFTNSVFTIKSNNTPCVYTIMLYTCYQNRQATTAQHYGGKKTHQQQKRKLPNQTTNLNDE